jgi:hypothetical protein
MMIDSLDILFMTTELAEEINEEEGYDVEELNFEEKPKKHSKKSSKGEKGGKKHNAA